MSAKIIFLISFSIIVFIILMVILFVTFITKTFKFKMFIYGISSICLILLTAFLVINLWFYNNQSRVVIKTSTEDDFAITLENHVIKYEYYYEIFSTDITLDEIYNIVLEQYDDVYFDDTLISINYNDNVFTIKKYGKDSKFLWKNRYQYILRNDTIYI